MYSKFLNKIYPLAHWWWITWSNYRWRNVERKSEEIDIYKDLRDIESIRSMLVEIYNNKYKRTADGIDQLFDSICPPPYNYKRYSEDILKDDCDGFHSLIYHFLHCNGYECYLLSLVDFGKGHCVLVYKSSDKWYLVNYKTVYGGIEDLTELIKNYNGEYAKQQGLDKVSANGLVEYDYSIGKFKNKGIIC